MEQAGLDPEAHDGAVAILMQLYRCYVEGDADLVEINPLILTPTEQYDESSNCFRMMLQVFVIDRLNIRPDLGQAHVLGLLLATPSAWRVRASGRRRSRG